MKKLLIFQFRTDQSLEHEQKCFKKKLDISTVKFDFVNPLQSDFEVSAFKDLNNYSGLILSGSAQYDMTNLPSEISAKISLLIPVIRQAIYNDFPTLGICFGHQLLAYILGSKVEKNPDMAETGGIQIALTKEGKKSILFTTTPPQFFMIEAHKDSVIDLPKGAVHLAKSAQCHIQSFRYKKNIYGVQFHPEIDNNSFLERVVLYPEYLKTKSLEEIKSSMPEIKYAATVLENFVKSTN